MFWLGYGNDRKADSACSTVDLRLRMTATGPRLGGSAGCFLQPTLAAAYIPLKR